MKSKFISFIGLTGFEWIIPIVKLISREEPKKQLKKIFFEIGIPVIAFIGFLFLWNSTASRINTSLGKVPGPLQVYAQMKVLYKDHQRERVKEDEFYERQMELNAQKLASLSGGEVKIRKYTGKPTYLDQIFTSLKTVFAGFVIASLVALPLGIMCGMSKNVMNAFNPFIQIFKPVSPLAWLPIVTMIVSALYTGNNGIFPKSFIISAITVALCSLWATLINTALGVASIDKDYMNVAKVLKLSAFSQTYKIVLPASLPLIFTGLRLSLGVGWMVLIAAEMLAQNPGLGKFIWDEFQNGSSDSLARIMVAVFTIGFIGFVLDRIMVILQQLVNFNKQNVAI